MRGPAIASMLRGEDAGPVTFSLDTSAKDLRTMLAEGAARGIDMPVVRETLACYEEASRNGLGERRGVGAAGLLARPQNRRCPLMS